MICQKIHFFSTFAIREEYTIFDATFWWNLSEFRDKFQFQNTEKWRFAKCFEPNVQATISRLVFDVCMRWGLGGRSKVGGRWRIEILPFSKDFMLIRKGFLVVITLTHSCRNTTPPAFPPVSIIVVDQLLCRLRMFMFNTDCVTVSDWSAIRSAPGTDTKIAV